VYFEFDDVGNTASVQRAFTFDLSGPAVAFTGRTPAAGSVTASRSAVVTYTSTDPHLAAVTCTVDRAARACPGGRLSLANLAAGRHTVTVSATDTLGHRTTISRTFTVRPRIAARVRGRFRVRGATTRVTSLTVTGAPARASVRITCRGKGCTFHRKTRRASSRGKVSLTSLFRRRALRSGARVSVTVSYPGWVSHVTTFTMRKHHQPRRHG
jgi:hypothetical protein